MKMTVHLQEGWDLSDLAQYIKDYEDNMITEDEFYENVRVEVDPGDEDGYIGRNEQGMLE